MKILITGANGMLGSSLCRMYKNNYEVYAFHRDSKCYAASSIDFNIDLSDPTRLRSILTQINPDLIIHCAGLTNVELCEKKPGLAYKENVVITENILNACSKGTKLVYISTDQVYGASDDHSELNINLKPLNQYGKTKIEGEKKIRELCNNFIIVRTNIFGWNVKPGKISSAEWLYYSLKKGDEITLFTDYTFSTIYSEFLGEIIMQLFEMGFTGIINAASPTSCSKYEFGISLAFEFGLDSLLIKKGTIVDHPFSAPRFHKLDLDISKLISLGITPPDYRDSIRRLVFNKQVMPNTN